jgi:hypothetical protein
VKRQAKTPTKMSPKKLKKMTDVVFVCADEESLATH